MDPRRGSFRLMRWGSSPAVAVLRPLAALVFRSNAGRDSNKNPDRTAPKHSSPLFPGVLVERREFSRGISFAVSIHVHDHDVIETLAEHLDRKPYRLDRLVTVGCRRPERARLLNCEWHHPY
jgi:hypothetical protein